MPVDLQPGEVPVVGTDGELYAVPEAGVGEAIRQGGRVATSQDLQEHAYGGIGGQAAAAGLGALETATMGGSSAVAGEYGVLTGGQERRRSIEEEIKQYERTNPISHVLGQAAPLLLMPEMAPEMGSVVAGESAAARALNFAVPRFIEGVAQDAWLQGSQGISEDALNHDFTGQSFLAHAADPSVLLGGVANVGAGAIAHGAGKLLGGGARSAEALGAAGRFASEDARSAEAVIAATQRSGRTSDEASAMFSRVQDLAQQAAADPTREGLIEKMARAYNRAQSGGSREVERALNRSFDEALDRFAGAERVLDRTTKEAVGHSDELLKGLAKLNDLQFGLKEQNVQKLIDVSRFTEQADRALQMRQEVRAYLESAVQGVDVRTPETKRLWDTVAKVDSEVGNAIEMKLAALGTPREERALREAAARMYVALDDGKRVIGRSAKFGFDGKDGSAQVAEHLYENFFRPMLEDTNLWGAELGKMQAATNATFSEGFASYRRYQQMVGQVLETPGGRKLYSTERGRMRSVLSELEEAVTPGDIQGMRAEVVQRVIDNTRARAASMIETMQLAPSDVAQVKRAVAAANKLEKTLQRAHGEAATARTLKELKSREMGSGIGGIIKSVTGMVTSPARTSATLGGLAHLEQRVRGIINSDARAFLNGERLMPTLPKVTAESRQTTLAAMKDLQRVSADPMILRERVKKLIAGIGDVSPSTATAVAVASARLVDYLASELPPPLPPRFLDTEPRWFDQDIDDFQQKLDAAKKPLAVFERLQTGRLNAHDQKMLAQVHPDIYQEMQIALLKEYRTAKEKGTLKKLDPQEMEMLSTFLQAPLTGWQQPAFVDRMQQAIATDPNAQGAIGRQATGGGRPRKAKGDFSDYETEAERISG